MNAFKSSLLSAAIVGALVSSAAQALVIDNFNYLQAASVTTATNNSVSFVSNSTDLFLGTSRTLTIGNYSGNANGANGIYADIGPAVLSMANGPAANSTITVEWTGINNINLAEGGANGLYFSLPTAIDNNLTITFALNNNTASGSRTFASGTTGSGIFFGFNEFTTGDSAAVNSVTSL
ncbi:hypothetical protein HUU62_15530 [Rhodoferax sp. 4810]|uniref:PEP-CTERM sorting domain-containing protein n=1 Tax=Thiospirillum jenense TaxID=1653858 RepID=A0A839HFQ3_9GAMM|nr:hypothetical protein [Thiospirillum jenense]MBB1075815.1 hypothetical protein [Rhodoferax jenense]MBB1126890.1 hypothetical protein [Thiospirillum jenense]